jgi:hypothetical protein
LAGKGGDCHEGEARRAQPDSSRAGHCIEPAHGKAGVGLDGHTRSIGNGSDSAFRQWRLYRAARRKPLVNGTYSARSPKAAVFQAALVIGVEQVPMRVVGGGSVRWAWGCWGLLLLLRLWLVVVVVVAGGDGDRMGGHVTGVDFSGSDVGVGTDLPSLGPSPLGLYTRADR